MPHRRGVVSAADAARWDLALACGLMIRPLRDMGEDGAVETLRQAWGFRREGTLRRWRRERPGERPWAWWEFDAGEPRPSCLAPAGWEAETRRLVELGVVDGEELEDHRRAEVRRVSRLTGTPAGLDAN